MPKQTLLLLPGLLCDARLWRDQVRAVSDLADCHVADLWSDDCVDAMARRAIAGMPQHFALAALSMGGYVAFALLRAVPGRVSRLMLMDTSARPDTPDQAKRRRGLMNLARQGRFRGVTPRLLPSLLHPDRATDTALGQDIMAMAARLGADAFLRQQAAILSRPDSRPDLASIAVPTAVVVGSGDQLTPPVLSQEMAAAIPGARLHLIDGAGHLPPMERPSDVNSLMREWLTAG